MLAYLMIFLLVTVIVTMIPYVTGRIVSENEAGKFNAWLIGSTVITLAATFIYLVYVLINLFANIFLTAN
jgi:hypothetical protein